MSLKSIVSIIIPVYNTEHYLPRCLNSILQQTYPNWELILIDDGSTDRSFQICTDFAAQNNQKPIKLISQKNSGVSSARNKGIQEASGEFMTFVDSDDWVSPDYLELLIGKYNESKSDIVIGNLSIEDEIHKTSSAFPSENLLLTRDEFLKLFGKLYSETLLSGPCVKLYSSSIIKKNQLSFEENRSLGEDLIFNLDYLSFCTSFCFFSNIIYFYRSVYDSSLSHKFNLKKSEIQYELYQKVIQFCLKQDCLNMVNQKYINTSFFRQTYIQMQTIILSDLDFSEKKKFLLQIIDSYLPNSLLEQIEIVSLHNKLVRFLIKHRLLKFLFLFVCLKNKLKKWKVNR